MLYFQNVVWFHLTQMWFHLFAKEKVRPYVCWFAWKSQLLNCLYVRRISPKLETWCGNYGEIHLHLLDKFLWQLLYQFLPPPPNKLDKKCGKYMARLYLRTQMKYGFHCTDLYKTHNCWMALHSDFLYQIFTQMIPEIWKVQVEIHLHR
jgi:hypothetical protein